MEYTVYSIRYDGPDVLRGTAIVSARDEERAGNLLEEKLKDIKNPNKIDFKVLEVKPRGYRADKEGVLFSTSTLDQ